MKITFHGVNLSPLKSTFTSMKMTHANNGLVHNMKIGPCWSRQVHQQNFYLLGHPRVIQIAESCRHGSQVAKEREIAK